jgi:hypothetical protein
MRLTLRYNGSDGLSCPASQQIPPRAWKNDFLAELLFANLKRRHKCKMQIKFSSFGY